MFWSKTPHTKAEHIAANKERDKRTRAHLLHMKMSEEQAENSKSTGYAEPENAGEGIDQDAGSQIGRQAQMAKEIINQKSKQLKGMRSGIRLSRRRARSRGRSLGF